MEQNPHQTRLLELLREHDVTKHAVRAATGCSSQRAALILTGAVELTFLEALRLLWLVGRHVPLPHDLPYSPVDRITRSNIYDLPKRQRKGQYKPVANDVECMIAITRARDALMSRMPPLVSTPVEPREDGNHNEAWLRGVALTLWNAAAAHGTDPRVALTEFCARMSLAILRGALTELGDRHINSMRKYCDAHRDGLSTVYDMIVRFIPDEQDSLVLLNASQLFKRYESEQRTAQTGESNG